MSNTEKKFYQRDYWIKENLRYTHVYFRTVKLASIINAMSRGEQCDLLDVGCGPETLSSLLNKNINYFGIDIAIQNPKQHLREVDITCNPIHFKGQIFDFVVAAGLFEYMGGHSEEKYLEIRSLLKPSGKFIVTYMNMAHCTKPSYPSWNNITTINKFKTDLSKYYYIQDYFPSYYSTKSGDLQNVLMRKLQLHFNLDLPLLGKKYGVNYIFICSLTK